jgi:hypothetical protein
VRAAILQNHASAYNTEQHTAQDTWRAGKAKLRDRP